MSLKVVVIGATNIPNPETFGKSDPYATVEFQGMCSFHFCFSSSPPQAGGHKVAGKTLSCEHRLIKIGQ